MCKYAGELDPGHAHLVHERDCERLRGFGAMSDQVPEGHRAIAASGRVPVSGGIGSRQLLSERTFKASHQFLRERLRFQI
jgi:hypothetical protein